MPLPVATSPEPRHAAWSCSWCCALVRPAEAQTTAVLQGRVVDESGAVVLAAVIRVRDDSTGFAVSVLTDLEGHYHIAAIPAGRYTVTAEASGFRTEIIEALDVDVGRTLVRNFVLVVGEQSETVVVRAEVPLVDRASATVGHVVTGADVQEIPLNGRHFTDLGLLVPGSVAPSQTGFSSRPIRGIGTLAFNTAGNREESVAFLVNGVSTNNQTFGSLVYEPPLGSIQEFKVDNSAIAAEHGHVSGAIVNLVTRSGTDRAARRRLRVLPGRCARCAQLLRVHDAGSASVPAQPVRRIAGRPDPARADVLLRLVRRVQTASGRGHEQRRAERRAARRGDRSGHSAADSVDPAGELLRSGRHAAIRRIGAGGGRSGSLDNRRQAQRRPEAIASTLFYGSQSVRSLEPTAQGNSIPGFGSTSEPSRNVLTIDATHIFGSGAPERSALRPDPPRRRHVSGLDAQPGGLRHQGRRHAGDRAAADDRRRRAQFRRARHAAAGTVSTPPTSSTTP